MAIWINKDQLAEYLSVKKRSIDYMLKQGHLPYPVRISERVPLWDLNEIEAFMAAEKEKKLQLDKAVQAERKRRESKPKGRPPKDDSTYDGVPDDIPD